MQIETIADLEKILSEQTATINALGELVRSMDRRIRLLTDLVDNHQSVIQKLTGVTPPTENTIVH
jgi:hypothetical protein